MPLSNIKRKSLRSDVRARLLQIVKTKLKNAELNEWLNIAVDNVQMELGNIVDLHYAMTEEVSTSDASHMYASATLNIIRLRTEWKKPDKDTGTSISYDFANKRITSTGITVVVDEWNDGVILWGDGNNVYFSRVDDTYIEGVTVQLVNDDRGSNLSGAAGNWMIILFPEIDFNAKMKLVDGTNGIVAIIDPDGIEGLSDIDLYDSEVFATLHGNEIHLFKGSNVSAYGTFTLWYRRRPIKMLLDNQPMDLPGEYKDLVVKSSMLIALEKLGKYQEMGVVKTKLEDSLNEFRQAFLREKATLKEQLQPNT